MKETTDEMMQRLKAAASEQQISPSLEADHDPIDKIRCSAPPNTGLGDRLGIQMLCGGL